MKKNEDRGDQDTKWLPALIVLPEVLEKLNETDAPVDVICEVRKGFKADDVQKVLEEFRIKTRPKHTDYYVFATLASIKDVERIDQTHGDKKKHSIHHVWLDKEMKSFVKQSEETINAKPTRQLFEAEGDGIHWAVLDTGIHIGHPQFAANKNCDKSRRFDFTGEGLRSVGDHGTHVAGIIQAIAPKVTLYDYKVLGKDGGSSRMIIQAMHHIRKMNFEAGKVIIHGANLSLGGPVPVDSYGCGWSPECQEANRLMNSGVVVCVAAGNDGYQNLATLPGKELRIFKTFMDVGISDPANAEDVITVGSTHKTRPHAFGPSFFSSKGPTGDGRCKPDCLAPGEKIVSAKAHGDKITMSGTSQATPHVSGAVALFLSAKSEFKGRPREVKKILMSSCTDLNRDRYFQGAGMIDVLRMVQAV
jgi:subtilisin family serine protease